MRENRPRLPETGCKIHSSCLWCASSIGMKFRQTLSEGHLLSQLSIQVALMFLTRGDMPHEASWAAWLRSAEGMVPIDPAQNALCAHKPDPGKCPWANGVRQVPRGVTPWPLNAD